MTRRPALLALADGTVFRGYGFGADRTITGEVCFNTGMTGYQEVLTDPSYHGQIVTMTAPQIGNTGVNDADDQSRHPWVAGFCVRALPEEVSNWRAEASLDEYLRRHDVPAIAGVDTRRLTRHIRTAGAMQGAVSTQITDPDELIDVARAAPSLVGRDIVAEVSVKEAYEYGVADLERRARSDYAAGAERSDVTRALMAPVDGERKRIAAYDFGMKQNILDLLVAAGNEVTVVPATTSADAILSGGFDGVFLSNGPGDPEPVSYAIDAIRGLVGRIPVFGICLGHQLLALALGAKTYKLPFGHRGSNHPVRAFDRDQVEITCQNHGFAVEATSIEATPAELSHVNLNDNTVEGIEVAGIAYSVQYHPESGPGPHDSRYLFEKFRTLMLTFEPADVSVGFEGVGAIREGGV